MHTQSAARTAKAERPVLPKQCNDARALGSHYRSVRRKFFPPIQPTPVKVAAPAPSQLAECAAGSAPLPAMPSWAVFEHSITSYLAQPLPKQTPNLIIVRRDGSTEEHTLTKRDLANEIVKHVCTRHDIMKAELRSRSRLGPIVRARHEVMFWLRVKLLWSYPEIGRFLGGKDHTTIMYGVDRHVELNKLLPATHPSHGGPYVIHE